MMPQGPDVASKRPSRRVALSALAALALGASLQAAPPHLTFEQLTVTSGAECGSFYPSGSTGTAR